MFHHAPTHRGLLRLERLEDRCTPSALSGDLSAHALAPPGGPAAAHAACPRQHAVPIRLSAHITVDGSGGLTVTGHGSHLGRFTGRGRVAIDTAADPAAVSGVATLTAANGDQLFVSISVSVDFTTGRGEETLTFTGGTGRFAGASGSATGACETTWDPASALPFECDSQAAETLVFGHSR